MWNKLKCFFGFHDWNKEIENKYEVIPKLYICYILCSRCGKAKTIYADESLKPLF